MQKGKTKISQRGLRLPEDAWALANKAAKKSNPETTRPKWIESAIRKQAIVEGVK